jgi:hypothetical protein
MKNNNTVHITKEDLNTEVSISNWIKNTFKGEVEIENIDPKDVSAALDGILRDKNFLSLSEEKKRDFIPILNNLKDKLMKVKKLE